MSRQIEQALLSLMPTYGQDLPPSLVELAGSLLAQSRHRASTLKAEEEIARLYACANIACDRLKISLDLPPIEPRPPIPPRIYKRLYTHLESSLPNTSRVGRSGSGRVRTPSSKFRDAGGSPASGSRPVPSRATPTKEKSLSQWRTPSKGDSTTPSKSTGKPAAAKSRGLNLWIQPSARFLCNETDHKALAPTILAGMESIVAPNGRQTNDEWVLKNLTAIFAAVYFFVTMKVKALASGEAVDRECYIPRRKEILGLLDRARKEVTFRGSDGDYAWDGWTNVKPKEFDNAVAQVNERGWLLGDWYEGITDVMENGQQNHDVEMLDDDDAFSTAHVRRADTMFQDKYDFLSDTKRRDFKVWKGAMLAKIDQLATTGTAMEVDA